MLYLIEILHQTTTSPPAQSPGRALYLIEILHQTTTIRATEGPACRLYLIEILHQTTTISMRDFTTRLLYLIEILHQTTTSWNATRRPQSCILSKFYIKPQLYTFPYFHSRVVSYRNSTSNHNTFES